jgi:hypothetical protein
MSNSIEEIVIKQLENLKPKYIKYNCNYTFELLAEGCQVGDYLTYTEDGRIKPTTDSKNVAAVAMFKGIENEIIKIALI